MRKIFTLSLLLAATAASARQISPDEALSAANAFLNKGTLTPVEATGAITRSDAQPYYAFNATDGNGFVIISGDDRYSKVLGYSDRGSFDFKNMPPQLKAMLDQFAENSAKHSNWNGTHSSWNNSFSATRADEGVLLKTANWGQDAPYNADCPNMGESNAPTGCVATAMAIVMKYHNWPETYNWDAMPMEIEYDGEIPPAANPELARLMKDVGEAVYMEYGPTESGAQMFRVGPALRYIFDYNPECQYIEKKRFQKDFWKNLIFENLDKGYPVIYGGFGSGGHAFVFDGYNSTGYHVNWGWDGWCNGYFDIDALNPAGADFNEEQSMILNVVPNKNHDNHSLCYTDYGYEWNKSGHEECMNISVENVKTGEPFNLFHSFGITAKAGFDGVIGMALVDKEYKIKEVLQTTPFSTYSPGDNMYVDMNRGFEFVDLVVKGDIASTDRLQLVSKNHTDSDYKIIHGTYEVPSSISVINNSPRVSKVSFDIAEGISFTYNFIDPNPITLPSGKTEITLLNGSNLSIYWDMDDKESDNTVAVYIMPEDNTIVNVGKQGAVGVEYSDNTLIKARILSPNDKTITLSTPGSLKEKVSLDEAPGVRSLTLTGQMDATDFWYIRDYFRSLESLDLKAVKIMECTATDNGSYIDKHAADELPGAALWAANSITHLVLPESLTVIGETALAGVFAKTLSIPKGVKKILKSNFLEIGAIESLNPEPPSMYPESFIEADGPSKTILFVPKGSAEKYKSAPVWQDFKSIIEGNMPANIFATVIKDGVKYECSIDEVTVVGYEGEPVDLVIPDVVNIDNSDYRVTNIKANAFEQCNSLESVAIGDYVSEIGNYSFAGCSNLKSVSLGKGLKKTGDYSFASNPKLEECNLPASLEIMGEGSWRGTNLKKVVIPASAAPANDRPVFTSISGLENFSVEDGNKWYKCIDGSLYRISEGGLILESVPCKKTGTLVIADNCTSLMSGAISLTGLESVVFNSKCEVIPSYAVEADTELTHITLPANAFIHSEAFNCLYNLKSVTFTGNLKMHDGIFFLCTGLNNIIIDSDKDIVDLNGIFATPVDEINIFTSSFDKNFEYSGKYNLFVAGASTDAFKNDEASEVQEMWAYGIDRNEKVITITPKVDGLAIERVLINGKEAENIYSSRADAVPAFVCAVDDLNNLNVTIEYTLFGSQRMCSEYKSDFNNQMPHSESGVDSILNESSVITEVYTIDGIRMLKNASKEEINRLPNGIYIFREGNRTRKVVVNN
ncbi:MAG: C10 family peptidase [Muribaculaceae bacterium]|nr:C10 family peptidase [Muribaculaceae bacterium]